MHLESKKKKKKEEIVSICSTTFTLFLDWPKCLRERTNTESGNNTLIIFLGEQRWYYRFAQLLLKVYRHSSSSEWYYIWKKNCVLIQRLTRWTFYGLTAQIIGMYGLAAISEWLSGHNASGNKKKVLSWYRNWRGIEEKINTF